MPRRYTRVTPNKQEASSLAKRLNISFKERGIKREAYVVTVSQSHVRKLTRKGFTIAKKNYGVAIRNKK